MIRRILRYLKPRVGRLNPSRARRFGEGLAAGEGKVGFIGFGPLAVVFDIPSRFAKPDPPVVLVEEVFPGSIEEINQLLKSARILGED